MSLFGGYADASGQVVADETAWAFGQRFASATRENLRHCENLCLEKINANELDFETSHKRVIRKDGAGYFRYFEGDPAEPQDSASAYTVVAGLLILLALPGQGGRLQAERLGSLPMGRELRPDDRVLPSKVGR